MKQKDKSSLYRINYKKNNQSNEISNFNCES